MQKTDEALTYGRQAAPVAAFQYGWLRNSSFDSVMIIGVAWLALISGFAVTMQPSLFTLFLFLDLWLLGYHHVVSTFTRLTFDSQSFKEYKFLIIWVPFIVLAAAVMAVKTLGPWTLATTYLYWQWFHYTRQSYGIAEIYRRKADQPPGWEAHLAKWMLYPLPLWGILARSYQNPSHFLGMELKCLPVPLPVLNLVAVLSMLSLAGWVVQQAVAFRWGRFSVAYALYFISHILIFAFGYLVIPNIDHGWLVINIWHNGQYILLVWMYNNNRFKNGVDPEHRFLSTLSQPNHMKRYFLTCFLISTAFYLALHNIFALVAFTALPLSLVAYQVINFHHYIVDGVVWKIRKKTLQKNLGLATWAT